MKKKILVINPGSSSRKYALFSDGQEAAVLYFEVEAGRVVGSITIGEHKHPLETKGMEIKSVIELVEPALKKYDLVKPGEVAAIAVRVVAPSNQFAKDQILTDELIEKLEDLSQKAPLHIATTLAEVHQAKKVFGKTPIVAVSDSAFHSSKPEVASRYAISPELADKHEILRFGYHGISVQSVVESLEEAGALMPKVIVCHLGSGSSITAVKNGLSVDTTMGFSPLEGLVMATRSGSIDLSAALALKHELQLSDDHLEEYLNKKSGLLGVSGKSNDIRELLKLEDSGDERAKLALDMFVYRIQQSIGQMAASMDGVSCLVFTATIGERSEPIRERVVRGLSFLGFSISKELNKEAFEPSSITDISHEDSKPVLVVKTSEAKQMFKQAARLV